MSSETRSFYVILPFESKKREDHGCEHHVKTILYVWHDLELKQRNTRVYNLQDEAYLHIYDRYCCLSEQNRPCSKGRHPILTSTASDLRQRTRQTSVTDVYLRGTGASAIRSLVVVSEELSNADNRNGYNDSTSRDNSSGRRGGVTWLSIFCNSTD